MASSINQNAYTGALPNFRNLGIVMRILLAANLFAFAAAILQIREGRAYWDRIIEIGAVVEPLLIFSVLVLVALSDLLRRMPYWLGAVTVLLLELALTTGLYAVGYSQLASDPAPLWRYWVLVTLATLVLLLYFDLRGRALSPALAEARLQALQARIRPHFLFNGMNAVLSLIRQDPKRAEAALEDMAELFRMLMADNRELAPLAREVELCRQYLDLEQLRLGDRLKVEWRTERMPRDAMVPPLVLQPLIENAVYHGVEPRLEPGVVSIEIYAAGERVHAVLRNPYRESNDRHAGNRMAVANIRERLQLHFDAEATLTAKLTDDTYQVHIVMPYIKERNR
jgi:two-component system, LytTR family, sensor histidine kinase AlgZ